MTNDDWKKVDNALKSVFSPGAKLLIDGYEVTLILCQKSQFQNAIAVYINGGFKGKWLVEDCEEHTIQIFKNQGGKHIWKHQKEYVKTAQSLCLSR